MHRAFETSTRRRRRDLSGRWEFLTDPGDEGVDAGWQESFPSAKADRISVPCSWTAHMEYADYVGPAWYRRTVHLQEATGVRLSFGGIGGAARVYLDGELRERTNDGAGSVSTMKPELDAGEHEIVVRVDNRPEQWELGAAEGVPHGGIYRDVVLEELPDVYVTNLSIDTELEGEDALVETEVTLHSIAHRTKNRRITVQIGDEAVVGTAPVAGRDASSLTLPLLLEDVDRWSPEDPTLYDVDVTVDPMVEDPDDPVSGVASVEDPDDGDGGGDGDGNGDADGRDGSDDDGADGAEPTADQVAAEANEPPVSPDHPTVSPDDPDAPGDHVRERIGFREIETDGREILLNGEPIEFAAVTRHEYHPDWGVAQPGRIQGHDLDVLEAAGVDAVRCPGVANPRFLDRCDEAGVLVLQGCGLRDLDRRITRGGSGLDAVRKRISGTIRPNRTHPSVIAWELVDEWATTEESVRTTAGKLSALATGIDDTRLVTIPTTADWGEERDRAVELCDVVSVADDRRDRDAEEWGEALDRAANRYAEKPIVVSSFGGAPESEEDQEASGDEGSTDWSESAQADRIEELIGTFREDSAVAGYSVWQYCDTPSDVSGIVSAYRQPKEAFGRLAALLDDD